MGNQALLNPPFFDIIKRLINKKENMKTLRQLIAVMSLMVVALFFSGIWSSYLAHAATQAYFELGSAGTYGLQGPAENTSAAVSFTQLVWGIINNVRYIIGAVAIMFIVYAGFRMVTGWGDESVYQKQRNTLLWSIIGLAVVGLSGEFARIFTVQCVQVPGQAGTCIEGGFLKDPNAIIRTAVMFDQRTQIIITFIKYFIGSVAVIMIISNGMRMITMGSSEEKLARDKKNLAYSVIGLILIVIADNIISGVFYQMDKTRYPSVGGAQPAVNAAQGVAEIVGITNYIVTFAGVLAVFALIVGGVLYITAGGKEELLNKARKLIFAALLGIVIIYGAFAIVSTFISGNFGNPAASTQEIQNAASDTPVVQ